MDTGNSCDASKGSEARLQSIVDLHALCPKSAAVKTLDTVYILCNIL